MSGLPSSGGQSLGNATARITLDYSDLQRGVQAAQQAGRQIQAGLNQINTGTNTAEKSIQSLSSTLTQLGSAVGVAFGARAVIQFALAADTTATAYKRQSVAALSLAGSQQKLNELLSVYDRVTGGVIDKATEMADITKLQAIGFADTTAELERFSTAARGISVGMGRDQDYVISQLQLELVNQRGARLDQIGLNKPEVAARVRELQAANHGLTQEMAYQTAVIDVAIAKFGKLVTSEVAQATGQEKAAKAWKNFGLEMGTALGPATGGVMQGLADQITGISKLITGVTDDAKDAKKALDEMRAAQPGGVAAGVSGAGGILGAVLNYDPLQDIKSIFSSQNLIRGKISSATSERDDLQTERAQMVSRGASNAELAINAERLKQANDALSGFSTQLYAVPLHGFQAGFGAPGAAGKPAAEDPNLALQEADKIEYFQSVRKIESSANADRLSATTQYESQRSETIRNYEQGIAREAEDFAISRRRAAENLAETIAQIGVDSARQATKWATDLADSIADMQADSGKRVAEAQEATSKRLAEINAEYAKSRERAARDHNDTLLEAAANLDARAVFNEQKAYARSSADASDAHDKAINDTNDRLKEQTDKEAENLADRIEQAQKANAKQLADAKEADELRIQQAKDALAKQQVQEDQDRALRLQRGAEDEAAQLAQMAQAQAERLAQIAQHATEERAALDEEFQKQLDKDGLHSAKWLENQAKLKDQALDYFDAFWKEIVNRFNEERVKSLQSRTETGAGADRQKIDPIYPGFASGGPVRFTGLAHVDVGEYMLNKATVDRLGGFRGAQQMAMTGGRSGASIGNVSFVINAHAGMNAEDVGSVVERKFIDLLDRVAA